MPLGECSSSNQTGVGLSLIHIFIAWDLPAVLEAAKDFFADSCVAQGVFHVFRRNAGAVRLWEREPEPEIHEETGSLLSAEDIKTLAAFDEGTAGYFGKMLRWLEDFIKTGVEEERFSEKQAHQDLQIALWYAFASNNLDDYIHYYSTVEWMKASEKNAMGCATWYYRYSVAPVSYTHLDVYKRQIPGSV